MKNLEMTLIGWDLKTTNKIKRLVRQRNTAFLIGASGFGVTLDVTSNSQKFIQATPGFDVTATIVTSNLVEIRTRTAFLVTNNLVAKNAVLVTGDSSLAITNVLAAQEKTTMVSSCGFSLEAQITSPLKLQSQTLFLSGVPLFLGDRNA